MLRLAAACVLSLVAAGPPAAETVTHKVGVKNFDMKGYRCSGNQTRVFYPKSRGRFPVAVYGHGSGGGFDGRQRDLEKLASLGFVVVAPNTGGYDGPTGKCDARTEWKDLRYVLKFGNRHVRKLIGKHKANWSQLGLWGYSMGGKAVAMAANHSTVPVRAMVASHGARHSDRLQLPSLYLTARGDNSSSPPKRMRQEFDNNHAESKVFVNLDHGGHEEPIQDGSMTPWVANFLKCHLSSAQDACDLIYGTDDGSLCQSGDFDECVAVSKDHVVQGSKICIQNEGWFRAHFDVKNLRSKSWAGETSTYGRHEKKCVDLGASGRRRVHKYDRFLAEVQAVPGVKRQVEVDVQYQPDAGTVNFKCRGGVLGFACKLVTASQEVVV